MRTKARHLPRSSWEMKVGMLFSPFKFHSDILTIIWSGRADRNGRRSSIPCSKCIYHLSVYKEENCINHWGNKIPFRTTTMLLGWDVRSADIRSATDTGSIDRDMFVARHEVRHVVCVLSILSVCGWASFLSVSRHLVCLCLDISSVCD